MSWMKRPRGSAASVPGPGQSAFNPTQPPLPGAPQLQQPAQWMGQQPGPAAPAPSNYPQPQQQPPQQPQYWQQPAPNAYPNQPYPQQQYQQYQQQQTQPFQNEYYQYDQQYSAQYGTQQQNQAYQQQNQPFNSPKPQANFQQSMQGRPTNETDSWDWDWQDDSAQSQSAQPPRQSVTQGKPQVNANVLADSFASSGDSWNWHVEEPPHAEAPRDSAPLQVQDNVQVQKAPSPKPIVPTYPTADAGYVNDSTREFPHDDNKNLHYNDSVNADPRLVAPTPSEPNIKTLNDREALKEHNISNVSLGRRFHNETLTPQWSIESQPSQDSSDGILSHTESRSEDPSRSSNKSSPGFHTNDNTNFNYAQPLENVCENVWESSYAENVPGLGHAQANDLIQSVRTMNINRESVSPDKNVRTLQGDVLPPPENVLPPQVATPPLVKPVANIQLPPSNKMPMGGPGYPPGTTPNQNPFKRSGQLSHRSAPRTSPMQVMPAPDNVLPPVMPLDPQFAQQEQQSARQASPSLGNIPPPAYRNNQAGYSTANLETTPDNSERPDIPPPVNYRPMQYPHPVTTLHQNIVENFEVAPSNDRNEYLQTGHLSDTTYDNTNFADDDMSRNAIQEIFPPPGFRRMVLGQPESEFGPNSSFTSDEPPPGLARMVPGQLTDSSNIYTQPNDDYLDRQIDGQTTESESLNNSAYMNRAPTVYRQVDGQPTDDESNYNPNVSSRSSSDRRPVGLDRMVPGESSSFNVQNFQSQNFGNASDERVVTGFGQSNASEPREQNMDGSDYSEVDANQMRSVVGAVENDSRNVIIDNSIAVQNVVEPELVQRDLDMEGENLQDLSTISSADFSMVRDQNMDGADIQDEPVKRIDILDSGSERQKQSASGRDQQHQEKDRKYRDDTTGDESERDRLYKNSRKEKDRLKSSKERDTRYSDRRDERRSDKDRRGDVSRGERDRDDRYRKPGRGPRYETEDTDYYSDRDRERRRYREGSYPSGKPPRSDGTSRAREEDSRRSYDRTGRDERDRRRKDDREPRYDSYESERDGATSRRRDRDKYERDEERDRRYGRDDRGYGSLRKTRSTKDDKKRGYPLRPDSRDPEPTEDELNETAASMKRDRRSVDRDREGDRNRQPRHRRDRDRDRGYNQQYYERYGYSMDPYSQQMYQHQQQTYQYYQKLRQTNPQAYLEFYNKYMAGRTAGHADPSGVEAYASMPGYESASTNRIGDERASVHSGRSSANGEIMKDRTLLDASGNYYYTFRRIDPTAAYRQTAGYRRRGSGSVRTDHSGSRDFNTDASINLGLENSTVKSERMTPVKFATAHIKGVISSTHLVTVNPSYPMDGQPAIVEILDLNKILINDPVRCELTAYPGPLVKGVTHKKTVIEYCEMKIRGALDSFASPLNYQDRVGPSYGQPHLSAGNTNSLSEKHAVPTNSDIGSYVLMWELLILLLRQNGMVVGTDIAELLVKNKRQFEWRGPGAPLRHHSRRGSTSSVTSRSAEMPVEEAPHQDVPPLDGAEDSSNDASLSARKTDPRVQGSSTARNTRRTSSNTNILESSSQEKYITDRFREYLLFGSGKEALEWAMSHGLWGHALFLASKLDRRTYANVMTRFANGLAANDPLQTLYQLMSGRQPASVTCVLDEKWGDWRPHLAMILSNTSQKPELDRKSITTLGDTLQSRGDTYGAHFCYLMAREEFHPARLQLLGLAPPLPAPARTPSSALIMTEIYEYACSLSQDGFALTHFQFYKYLLATRLVDCGLYERALFYMESIATVAAQAPDQYQTAFLDRVLQMADRLKHFDPEENVGELPEDGDQYADGLYGQADGQRSSEKSWVTNLRRVLNDLKNEAMHAAQTQQPSDYSHQLSQSSQYDQQWNQTYQQQPSYDQLQLMQQMQLQQQTDQQPKQETPEAEPAPMMYNTSPGHVPQVYSPLQYQGYDQTQQANDGEGDHGYGGPISSSDSGYWNHDQQQNYGFNEDRETMDALEPQRPQISMPNANRGNSAFDDGHDDHTPLLKPGVDGQNQPPKKEAAPPGSKPQSTGWLGGIFNKLSLKPKNQMILPDDKNPSIVWDSDKKKWVNLDADEDEQQSQLTLPPKMSDIMRPGPINNNNNNNSYQPPELNPPLPVEAPPSSLPPGNAPMPNIFKLQKGRHIKKSYVDVFNPSGAPIKPLPPASEVLGATVQAPVPTSYFVPGASNNNNPQGAPTFYNPADY